MRSYRGACGDSDHFMVTAMIINKIKIDVNTTNSVMKLKLGKLSNVAKERNIWQKYINTYRGTVRMKKEKKE